MTFTVHVVDVGRSDRLHRDRFAITVRDRNGSVVFAADWPLRSGEIRVGARSDEDDSRTRATVAPLVLSAPAATGRTPHAVARGAVIAW